MSTADRQKFEYESENELIDDYKKLLSNPSNLNIAIEYLFESLLDDAVMGVAFQMHYENKFPVSSVAIFIYDFWS